MKSAVYHGGSPLRNNPFQSGGSGTLQDLQSVTDQGNTTTNPITVQGATLSGLAGSGSQFIGVDNSGNIQHIAAPTVDTKYASLVQSDSLTPQTLTVANKSGLFFQFAAGNATKDISIDVTGFSVGDWVDFVTFRSLANTETILDVSLTGDTGLVLEGFSPIVSGIGITRIVKVQPKVWVALESARVAANLSGLLIGNNVYNCSNISGFTNKFTAIKVSALNSGIITTMSGFVYNVYGAGQGQAGIYDIAGTLLSSTALQTLPAGTNGVITGELQAPVTVTAGNQYWLGVWGDGIDIPTYNGFNNLSSSFPNGTHCITHNSLVGGVPLTFDSSFPFSLDNNTIPLNGLGV